MPAEKDAKRQKDAASKAKEAVEAALRENALLKGDAQPLLDELTKLGAK